MQTWLPLNKSLVGLYHFIQSGYMDFMIGNNWPVNWLWTCNVSKYCLLYLPAGYGCSMLRRFFVLLICLMMVLFWCFVVSIARRLQDPLSELVKIDPHHVGVGMYQHDIPEVKLKTRLDLILSECVSFVGVDINTASHHILRYHLLISKFIYSLHIRCSSLFYLSLCSAYKR